MACLVQVNHLNKTNYSINLQCKTFNVTYAERDTGEKKMLQVITISLDYYHEVFSHSFLGSVDT